MGVDRRLAAAVFAAAYLAALVLVWLNGPAKALGIKDYISDEVWYVSSAVNVARKILGLHIVPDMGNGTVVYTIFYDNTTCSKEEAVALVESLIPGAHLVNKTYVKISALVVTAPRDMDEKLARLPQLAGSCITDAMPGIAPDNTGINEYLNTEHPPLVKYIIILALLAKGWDPAAWRLASFTAAAIGLLAATYAAYLAAVSQRRRSAAAVLLAAAIIPAVAARDPAIQSMSTVAMLDIYVAALDAVSLALLARGRLWLSGLFLGLAGSAKYTGFFPLPALLAAAYAETRDLRKTLAASLVVPMAVLAAAWTPFLLAKGPAWLMEQVASAIAWHTSSRPPGPPSTSPLGLILGRDGFPLYYTKEGKPLLVAVCNPGVCLLGVALGAAEALAALTAFCIGKWCSRHRVLAANGGHPSAAWLGYVAVYAAGNHTLYSFYSVQLSMLSIPALAALPLLIEEAGLLRPRSLLHECPRMHPEYAASAAAALGLAASAAASHGWPMWATGPLLDPLASALNPASKLSKIGLFASALVLYTTAAIRSTPRGSKPLKAATRWLLAGLLAYTGPLAPMAPVLYLAASRPGLPESLLAGLAGPGPAGLALAAAHRGGRSRATYALGYTLGYLAALQVLASSTPTPPIADMVQAAILAAAAGTAVALASLPQPPRLATYSAAALLSPSALPLLPLAPMGEPVAAIAALAALTGSQMLAEVAAAAGLVAAAASLLEAGEARG